MKRLPSPPTYLFKHTFHLEFRNAKTKVTHTPFFKFFKYIPKCLTLYINDKLGHTN